MPRFFKPQQKQAKNLPRIDEPLIIESLSDDGRGITHHQGKIVFVEGGLPNEHVQLRVVGQNSRFLEARAVAVHTPSEHRVQAFCRHAAQCGGCSVQYMSHAKQRNFKQAALVKQLQQQGLSGHTPLNALYDKPFAYRNRIRLGVRVNKSGELCLGFRQKQSQQLVAIRECPVMLPVLEQLIQPLYEWLQSLNNAPVTHIELLGHTDSRGVVIRHTRNIQAQAKQVIKDRLESLGVHTWFQASKHGSLENEQGEPVDPRLFYPLADGQLRLYYHPQDFIQANSVVNEKMIDQALSLLKPKPKPNEHFADLFCGIGNFSLPLSKLAGAVYGYEGVQTMVDRATANAMANACHNAHFAQADLGAEGASVYDMPPVDGVLLDPPRAGAKLICANISKLAPKRIAYVSCNTATFARDAKILCNNGYQLVASGVMDMFPQTSHTEVIGLFKQS